MYMFKVVMPTLLFLIVFQQLNPSTQAYGSRCMEYLLSRPILLCTRTYTKTQSVGKIITQQPCESKDVWLQRKQTFHLPNADTASRLNVCSLPSSYTTRCYDAYKYMPLLSGYIYKGLYLHRLPTKHIRVCSAKVL